MDEEGLFRAEFRDVMIDDHPVGFVHAQFECQVCHPRGSFPQVPLLPVIVMAGLQPHLDAEELARQPLQQHARNQPVEIAFVREYDLGPRE